jgi:hypothetical protein
MSQVIKYLPSKKKALSLNPSTSKRQNKKRIKLFPSNLTTAQNKFQGYFIGIQKYSTPKKVKFSVCHPRNNYQAYKSRKIELKNGEIN